jgi:phosphoglycerol transferase MdoB-like AlkP superfamily enzyme
MLQTAWSRWVALAVALAALNFGLTFDNLWPTLWIKPRAALSVELAVLVLGLALVAQRFGPPSRRVLTWLSVGFVVLALSRYAEVMAREFYGRPINLYYDAPHVPRVLAMFVEAAPPWLLAGVAAGAVLGLLAVFGLVRWAWSQVAQALAGPRPRRALALLAIVACAAYPFAPAWFTAPVTASYARQAVLVAHTLGGGAAPLAPGPAVGSDFARIDGADVFVIFVESYGATTYDRPEHAARLASSRAALAAAVAATGGEVVSAFVESPTFGGASWLAHASLLAGVDVRGGDAYNLLMTERRDTLVQAFARHGYRTVALMPGLRRKWREGAAFYAFDEIYGADRLGYRGPEFGWWRIPDQYALAKLDEAEVSKQPRRPLFVFFPTINSHAPFRPTPPYQPDWARLLSDRPYDADVERALRAQRTDWTNLEPAYAESVAYVLAWLSGYLRERPGADTVLIVIGDHQPPVGVGGEHPSWEVPVHIIAKRRGVLEALVAGGFTPGLEPRRPAIGRTHELTPMLLWAFGSGSQPGVDIAGAARGGQLREPRTDRVGL